MEILTLTISFILLLIVYIFIAYQFVQLVYAILPKKTTHLPSPTKKIGISITESLSRYVDDTKDLYFVELGSGLSEMTNYMLKQFDWRGGIAIDSDLIIFTIGRLSKMFNKQKVMYVLGDIFCFKVPEKSVIYCYLNTNLMRELYEKKHFESMLVYSAAYPIPDVPQTEEIKLGGLIGMLYIYDFRLSVGEISRQS